MTLAEFMANPTRRHFMQAGTSLVVTARGIPLMAESMLAPGHRCPICIVSQERRVPASLTTHARYRPEPAATPEPLLKCMQGAGFDCAIVVPQSITRTTTATLNTALRWEGRS